MTWRMIPYANACKRMCSATSDPIVFLCDQEGAAASDVFSYVCDKLGIGGWLAGSDPSHLCRGGKRTSTCLAGEQIDLIKLPMLKTHAERVEQCMTAAPSEIVAECMMASSIILSS